jgi:hypothetical protein
MYATSTRSFDMTRRVRIRPVAFVAAILFLLSWVFPVGTGLARDTSAFPKWWGPADVGLAFVLKPRYLVIGIDIRSCSLRTEGQLAL